MDKSAAPLHRATAVLVDSNMMKAAVNFFGRVTRSVYPHRAFSNEEQAVKWLLSLHETHLLKEQAQRNIA
jgi:hypothetical protein